MEGTEANVGTMEAQLKQWGARLDGLIAKAAGAGADVKADYRKRVDDLKAKCQGAQARLDEARAAGSGKWKTLKTGVQSALKDIEAAFRGLKE